uniref:Uncharacterized protein n=1 Tax=Amphimedon queenslandica TaxID=400682 RepID=A0A1X7URU1_AMPQE
MSPIFLLSLLLIAIACSDGATTAKKRSASDVTKWLEKIDSRLHSEGLMAYQNYSVCTNQLNNILPLYCNISELSGRISSLLASSLSNAQLDQLNAAYSQLCVPECLNPIEGYYNCLKLQFDHKNYLVTLLRQGICGQDQESGEYCGVIYIRQYRNGDQVADYCTNTTSGIVCRGASSICLSHVSNFSSRMGCCTQPYLGSGVTSCSGVNVSEPCIGVSSATGLVAPAFVMLFAFASFFA